MYLLAIDIGLSGGLCFYNMGIKDFVIHRMPTVTNKIKKGKYKKEIDWKTFYRMLYYLKGKNSHVVFEKMVGGSGYSKRSVASFFEQVGHIKAFCTALNLPYSEISPKKWQAEMFKGVKAVKRPSRTEKGKLVTDTKSMAVSAFKLALPNTKVPTTEKGVLLDGCVDSALITLYALKTNLNVQVTR